MINQCENLLNLYKYLLSKKDNFSLEIKNINKENVIKLKILLQNISEINDNICKITDKYESIKQEYNEYYKKEFGDLYKEKNIEPPDFSKIKVKEKPNDGLDYMLVFFDNRLDIEDIIENIKKSMDFFTAENLNFIVPYKMENNFYCLWVQPVQVAPEFYKEINISSDYGCYANIDHLCKVLKRNNLRTITLNERLIFEKIYFIKTGKHLDVQGSRSYTLCTESRNIENNNKVVYVFYRPDSLQLRSRNMIKGHSEIRVRIVF